MGKRNGPFWVLKDPRGNLNLWQNQGGIERYIKRESGIVFQTVQPEAMKNAKDECYQNHGFCSHKR